MRRSSLPALAAVALLLAAGVTRAADHPLDECLQKFADVGVPVMQGIDALSASEFTLLCRDGYLLSHNNERKVPDWVMERLVPERFEGDATRGRSAFAPDLQLQPGTRSELNDYASSGFDRGHMSPAADAKYDQVAMDESFLLSNMAPQVGIGFNRHIWAHLEDAVRGWTERRRDLVVITGPIYQAARVPIGTNHVAVPSHFFKIAYEPRRNRAVALILPNEKIKGNDLGKFVRSIDEIEELTGFNFLTALSKPRQRAVEKNVATLWEQ
jgi:endonuclease G, mitochondrial